MQRGIAGALTERLAALCREVRPGVTWQETSRYAPLIDARQGNKVQSVIEAAKAQGADVLVGGDRFADTDEGWFWQPTLLTQVKQDNPAVQQEIFGPVLTIQTFDSEDEGLGLAAHETYGLCAGVHTLSLPRAMRAIRESLPARYGSTATGGPAISLFLPEVSWGPVSAKIWVVRRSRPASARKASLSIFKHLTRQ